MAHPAIVLLSGGLDSAVALACARRDGHDSHDSQDTWALSFDYGQRHRHELAAAARVAKSLGAARHVILNLDLRAIGGSALTADIDVPKDRPASELSRGVPITYVPARNLIFLSCAAALAETARARDIYIGVNAVDYSGYPDCRAEFIKAFEQAANLGTKAGVESADPWLRVRTPLVTLTKAEIIKLGTSLGVDFSLTHSCYDPVVSGAAVLACGRCDSCQIRARGFKDASVPDPTRYADRSPAIHD
jgi:7-cyano-7-deazaguanine synthase